MGSFVFELDLYLVSSLYIIPRKVARCIYGKAFFPLSELLFPLGCLLTCTIDLQFYEVLSHRLVPLYSWNFSVSDFKWQSLLHLNQIFMQSHKCRTNFVLLHIDIWFIQNQLLKMLSFLHCLSFASLSNIRGFQLLVLVLVSFILFH